VFTNGELKLRGLACRRSDTPEFIKDVQQELLALLAQAKTLAERAALRPQLEALLQLRSAELAAGEIAPQRLQVRQTLSQAPEDYTVATRAALAAEQYRAAGIPVHPGERLSYVLKDITAKDKAARIAVSPVAVSEGYDVQEYLRLLRIAAAEVLANETPFLLK
jgi:DNA polymerase, archaea type